MEKRGFVSLRNSEVLSLSVPISLEMNGDGKVELGDEKYCEGNVK